MTQDKVIHTRVSDTIYEKIVKKAEENGLTVSGYSRIVFEEHDKIITKPSDPFEADEFNNLIQWIYNAKHYPLAACIFDIRHYLSIIKKYYHSLDFTFQRLLNNIIENLNQLIIQAKEEEKEYPDFQFVDIYLFGREKNSFSFDYDSFEKYLMNKSM